MVSENQDHYYKTYAAIKDSKSIYREERNFVHLGAKKKRKILDNGYHSDALYTGLFGKAMKEVFPEAEVSVWHRSIFLNFLLKW